MHAWTAYLRKRGSNFWITLPKKMREQEGITVNTKLLIDILPNNLITIKKPFNKQP